MGMDSSLSIGRVGLSRVWRSPKAMVVDGAHSLHQRERPVGGIARSAEADEVLQSAGAVRELDQGGYPARFVALKRRAQFLRLQLCGPPVEIGLRFGRVIQ